MVSIFCFELMSKRETSKENSCCSTLVCLPPIYNENYSGILISRTSRYLEPNLVSLGFTLALTCQTLDFSNQFFSPWDKLTLDNSNLRKFRNNLVRMSITSMPRNKLTLPDKLFSHILITQQASHKSVISLKGTMTALDYRTKVT